MLIHEFDKNKFEKVQISLNEYQGKQYIDFRVFYDFSEDDNEKWLPTKKGITISLDLLSELKKGIDKALSKAEFEEK